MKRFLIAYLKTLVKGLLLFALILGGCVFMIRQSNRAPYDWEIQNQQYDASANQAKAEQQRAANKANAELQTLIADVYHVETSRFIQPDLLWITLPPGSNIQATCQAIANLWAHRSGLAYVRVESWSGTTRLGQGTVYGGNVVTP